MVKITSYVSNRLRANKLCRKIYNENYLIILPAIILGSISIALLLLSIHGTLEVNIRLLLLSILFLALIFLTFSCLNHRNDNKINA